MNNFSKLEEIVINRRSTKPTAFNGQTIDEFIEQVFNYPTLSETYKYAAYDGLGNLAGHKLREG